MRLHHLEITAFGPFAETVTVDFDVLSSAGLFLLTGATGAGKTSVLDAVCFALYGDVPGDRSTAKRLRSDQADVALAPRVVLEATLAGRRFQIARSPGWRRPKRRGTGLTTEQPSVSVAERLDGSWRTLSTRLDETGHLVTGLIGMNLDQFCQVAMLPQGRFQAFLRARSEDRHRLLQQLFRTGRFEAVEDWLRDHRLELRRTTQARQAEVAGLVHRVSEAAAAPAGSWEANLDAPGVEVALGQWADDLRTRATVAADRARRQLRAAEVAAEAAVTVLAGGRQTLEAQQRRLAAQARQALLAREEPLQSSMAERLDAAVRAAGVAPLVELATRADRIADEAAAAAATALAQTTQLAVPAERLAEARDRALTDAAAARALAPRERELVVLRTSLETHAVEIARLDEKLRRLGDDLARLPGRLAACRRAHAAASGAAAALPAARALVVRLREQQAAVAQLATLTPQLTEARDALVLAVDQVHVLTERWLDLRERRLDGMAAEIAVGLVVGGCCPVCGSADHPQPARPEHGSPDADAEREARRQVDDAEAIRLLREGHLRDLTTRIALARQAAGGELGDRTDLSERITAGEAEVGGLGSCADTEPSLAAELRRLEGHAEELGRQLEAARRQRGDVASAASARRAELAATSAQVEALLRGAVDGDLSTRADRLTAVAERCAAALAARAAATGAAAEALRARQALELALAEAGFADVPAARAAALPPVEVARLDHALRDHAAARAATRQVLDDPELARTAGRPAPDLPALQADEERCRRAVADAAAEVRISGSRDERLARLHEELIGAVQSWQPVRAELELVTGLATMVDGRSPDNRLQMRLSAYVLAYRLSQVVEAANDRLARMSDQRYSLAHTGRRGVGETRGGLSLLVRDDWSGETRDPATLSGGETFVVSLALALGLADVITGESDSAATGDSRLATLFVDEGFGSLDADTLDDVMDTLDSLREGGRVVGVVSHVAEMRDRIPVRLEVTKHRRGSRVHSSAGMPTRALGSSP